MESGRVMRTVVHHNLTKPTPSNPSKSYAVAILDGSATKDDLIAINTTTAFASNNRNHLKLPEGEYSSMDVMIEFVEAVGQYLSDAQLYHITHLFTEIETTINDMQAFRNSTLAKFFLRYEKERHVVKNSSMVLPQTFLSHVHEYVFPLMSKHWPNHIAENINTFVSFNFYENKKIDAYDALLRFDMQEFKVSALATELPCANREAFLQALLHPAVKKRGKKQVATQPSSSQGNGRFSGSLFTHELPDASAQLQTNIIQLRDQIENAYDRLDNIKMIIGALNKRLCELQEEANPNKQDEISVVERQLSTTQDKQSTLLAEFNQLLKDIRICEDAFVALHDKIHQNPIETQAHSLVLRA